MHELQSCKKAVTAGVRWHTLHAGQVRYEEGEATLISKHTASLFRRTERSTILQYARARMVMLAEIAYKIQLQYDLT